MNDDAIPADKLVRVFIKMRDRKQQLTHEYETEVAKLDTQMDEVKSKLLETCEAIGANSLRTDFGTVVRTVKTRYWTSDWEQMHSFVKQNDAVDLLERRIHQTNMKTYLEEHPDKIPPGLNSDSHYEVTVRRK